MTDTSPGPGWWLASDGRWYPPHLHPAATSAVRSGAARATSDSPDDVPARVAPRTPPTITAERAASSEPAASPEPAVTPPTTSGSSIDWNAIAQERAAQRAARQRREAGRRRMALLVALATVAVVLIVVAAFVNGDDAERSSLETAPPATTAPTATTAPQPTAVPPSGASLSTPSTPSTTAAPAAATGDAKVPGPVSVFSLQPGACIDQENLTTGLVTTVRTVPCTARHTHEVYLRTAVTPVDGPYDSAKVTAFADKACTEGFTSYVGVPYEQSKYYYVHLAPSAESWNKSRDRDVLCLVLLEGQTLTSSVKGKGE